MASLLDQERQRKREPEIAKLVVFGSHGDTVHVGCKTTISGHGWPERPHAAKQDDDLVIPDNTPVLDLRTSGKPHKDDYGWPLGIRMSVSEYVRSWKGKGARIGRYMSGSIVWEGVQHENA